MCNEAQLKRIKRKCQEGNTPGMSDTIYLSFMDEVVSVPAPAANTTEITTAVGFRPAVAASAPGVEPVVLPVIAGAFVAIDVRRKNGSYKAGQKGDGENVYFEPEWEYTIDKIDPVTSYRLQSMRGAKMLLVSPDKNGKQVLCENVYVTHDAGVTDSENGYKLKIMGDKMPHEPRFYSGAIVLRDNDPN